MIIVDASVLCAILLDEPERDQFVDLLTRGSNPLISPVNYWEALVSMERRLGDSGAAHVERLCERANVRVAAMGQADTALVFNAWRSFGKGRHPAALNLGDCFAYALAKSRGMPLLFKGDDFPKTDVRSAL